METIFSLAFPLFLLMDSFGNVPIYVSILKEFPPKRQRFIIFREMLIALISMIIFYFIGDTLLAILQADQSTVMIAGGLILFLIALKMIFPVHEEKETDLPHQEPFIVPLAIPLIVGPATLAAIMLYSHQEETSVVVSAIILAWAGTTIVLFSSSFLKKLLGVRGMLACERLMGLIITLLSIEMFLEGIRAFLKR